MVVSILLQNKEELGKMERNEKRIRYPLPDVIRGTVLINAIAYHGIWDLVYLFGMDWEWYTTRGAYWWQQAICWTFILLSGFCWSMGRRRLRRGVTVFGAGLLVMAVTLIFMPQDRVLFGVLTLIGSGMLLWIPLEKGLVHVSTPAGLAGSVLLFLLTRNVADGYLGFEGWNLWPLPEDWYANLFTTYLGLPGDTFYSTDYFGLFPWLFLFGTGYFLYRLLAEKKKLSVLGRPHFAPLEFVGRHSLGIYLLHQPVLYGILTLLLG